jgi:hypothetical protein
MMTLKTKAGLVMPVMRATMNEEYFAAKANLCLNQAEIDLKEVIKNLERANSALYRLGLVREGEADE